MKKIGLILSYILIPLPLIFVLYSTSPTKYEYIKYLIPMILGSIAYVYMIGQLVLSSRIKVIDKIFGLDKIMRFHGLIAILAIITIYVHKFIMEDIYGENEIGDLAFNLFLIVIGLSIIFFTNIKIFTKIKNKIKKIFNYDINLIFHNLSILAVILMFLHVQNSANAKKSVLVQGVYTAYFIMGITLYLYHKFIKVYILSKKAFIVKEIIKENDSIRTIVLKAKNDKIFSYKPGQFAFIRFIGYKTKEQHPFTISSSPINGEDIRFTVKNLGDFSKDLDKVKLNSIALIDAPYGIFSYKNNIEDNLVFIAGGIGITPFMSMLKTLSIEKSKRNVTIFWGVNSKQDIIFENEFKNIKKNLDNLKFVPIISNSDDYIEAEKGYFTDEIFKKYVNNIDNKGFYICGPEILLNKSIKILKDNNVKNQNIYYEKFSL